MTEESKNIPLLLVLEYMQEVNNLLNHLVREDNFPAILFAKYDDTFRELLRMAQVMNYKFRNVANEEMKAEAIKFAENLDKWEDEYRNALKTKPDSELGLRSLKGKNPTMPDNSLDVHEIEERVKDVLGQDLFDQVLGRLHSKSREAALGEILKDMSDKGDIDEDMVN